MLKSFKDLFSLIPNNKKGQKRAKQPDFTTFKYRKKEGWVKRTIDYIFIAKNDYFNENNVSVSEYLNPADLQKEDLLNNEVGNPCPNHPSDHYSLGYKINFPPILN